MGMVSQVVESSSALILQVKSEDLKAAWQYYLALATYKASVSSENLHVSFVDLYSVLNSLFLYQFVHLLDACMDCILPAFLNLLVLDGDKIVP